MSEEIKKVPKEEILKDIKEIVEGKYTEEATASIGENRNQLFVRIPQIVSKRLKLKKGQKLLFKVFSKNRKQKFSVELEDGSS